MENGEESVGDGRLIRRFPLRALRVDMDPLQVAGDAREFIDLLLRDFVPLACADFLADALSQLIRRHLPSTVKARRTLPPAPPHML
jgi:hypothetical protein